MSPTTEEFWRKAGPAILAELGEAAGKPQFGEVVEMLVKAAFEDATHIAFARAAAMLMGEARKAEEAAMTWAAQNIRYCATKVAEME